MSETVHDLTGEDVESFDYGPGLGSDWFKWEPPQSFWQTMKDKGHTTDAGLFTYLKDKLISYKGVVYRIESIKVDWVWAPGSSPRMSALILETKRQSELD